MLSPFVHTPIGAPVASHKALNIRDFFAVFVGFHDDTAFKFSDLD
jgi:hypothetical protein